jgi:hypothetical protein
LDWSHVGERAHFVQFYEDEMTLVPLLSRYIGAALVRGDGAVMVATPTLREHLAANLLDLGYDVDVARTQGRYFALDASRALRGIMRAGWPDPVLFDQVIGNVVTRASDGGRRRVAVFGEMVSVLWAGGHNDAAIRLEQLWNDLAAKHSFALCCAYPISGFADARHAPSFVKICSQHSHVFSPENNR